MKRFKLIALGSFLIMVLVFYSGVTQVKAVGPVLEEGSDGFLINVGDILSYKVTAVQNVSQYGYDPDWNVNDILRFTISTTNNSYDNTNTFGGDMVWGYMDYYNTTELNWTLNFFGSEYPIAMYNSTHPLNITGGMIPVIDTNYFPLGLLLGLFIGLPTLVIAPRNFTATNQSLVNFTYTLSLSLGLPFAYNTPTYPSLNGAWDMRIGNYNDNDALRLVYAFNENGINTKNQMFFNGTSGWTLVSETVLISDELTLEEQLLLLIALGSLNTGLPFWFWYVLGGGIAGTVIIGAGSSYTVNKKNKAKRLQECNLYKDKFKELCKSPPDPKFKEKHCVCFTAEELKS